MSETNGFDPGDVWHIPRGYSHSIRNGPGKQVAVRRDSLNDHPVQDDPGPRRESARAAPRR